MKQPKFKIGQTVYPQGCSPDYQKSNPLVIGKIEKSSQILQGDEGEFIIRNWMYAEVGSIGYYPEQALESEVGK